MPLKKYKPVAEILCVIISHERSKRVVELLQEHNVELQMLSMGKGTADSKMAEMFNLGNIEKDVISAVISVQDEEYVIENLQKLFEDGKTTGIAFTIPIKSATSDIIDLLNLKK